MNMFCFMEKGTPFLSDKMGLLPVMVKGSCQAKMNVSSDIIKGLVLCLAKMGMLFTVMIKGTHAL